MGTPSFDVGDNVWVPDPQLAWIDGVVVNIKGKEADIETSDGKMVVAQLSKLNIKDMDAPAGGIDDMTKLVYLHEPGILHNLGARYEMHKIYTYTGNILIAVNPFQSLSHLYDDSVMEQYRGKPLAELSPHVYAIAEAAYRAMIHEERRNSILVSGESGAGKTETTKMLMRYLAFLGGHTSGEGRTVERKVLESNPVLEAFGNAKTVRNNNSSRFGKFVEIQFDDDGRISGAAIRTYLLEKSRVCQISDPERNYHCFYLLCAAPAEDIEKYKLGNPETFHYLNQSSCFKLGGVNDANEYLETKKAMDIVGISGQDQDAIFRLVAAILHLGNIHFAEEEDISVLKDDTAKFHLQMTAELLMCDPLALEDALCKRTMITREEVIKKSLNPVGAAVSRDGLAKTIYSTLFNWLVDKINISIGQDIKSTGLIGVLDIYGFESFQTNSFEQLCINFTNEKLQQHFNQHVFKMDQEEYAKEDISWSYINFVDNKDVLDLIEKKPGGIISLLDEACMFPKSTHETFAEKLYQTFKSHKRFIKPKLTRSDFTIIHYAGEVQYQSDQFLDKNKDYVVPEHQDLLSASKCYFVASLFPPPSEDARKTSKFSSIGSRFKQQLQQLMDTLNSTKPHYIRCVKPNTGLQPAVYDNLSVLQQLRSGGVLEAIKIKCGGFPTRMTFEDFLSRFAILAKEILNESCEESVACKRVLEKTGVTGYEIGKTKVFLRSGQMAELDAQKARLLRNAAMLIQGKFKTKVARKHFITVRSSSIGIQTIWRGKLARRLYYDKKREKAAVHIQKNLRRMQAKRSYNDARSSAVVMQAGMRAMSARIEYRYRAQSRAARIIQAYWRGFSAFSYYKNLRRAAVVMHYRWRKKKGHQALKMTPHTEDTEERNIESQEERVEETKESEQERVEETKESEQERVEETKELQQERVEETKESQHEKVEEKKESQQEKVEEANVSAVERTIEEASSVSKEPDVPLQDDGKIKTLTAEVENLKALLQAQKQRADELEKKYAEAHESSEKRLKKLKESEKRVKKLQVSLKRMIYSMSDQFTELKTILRSSSNSSSTSGVAGKDDQADGTSNVSEGSSGDSDFGFPPPSHTPVNINSLSPDALQVMVQDITGVDASDDETRA